uniref:Integrase, catalytic region, zinc finger, CCHC-type, peptidase aspartic, catalytic n=1 Tax=Tanacetum cinerariifolium TaxID=118510 RepID=A0A699ITL2_TANCI|nr:integrase, catalytic region, zinc finger, CCHC-type, peptidase aspartic, catalytic [Tanacetum cinerariifolium]
MGLKKKTVVVTSDPLALIVEKTKVSKSKEKVVVSSDSEGSDADDITNNNLRTSSTSQSANKKQEFIKTDDKKVEKKDDKKKRDMSKVKCYNCKKEGHFVKDSKKVKVKDYEYYKTKMLLAKKDKDKQVLLAEYQAWMESSSDSDQEINANMVFMAQTEKVLSDSETSSTSADDKIYEIADQEVLYDKMSVQLVELDKHVRDLKNTVLEKVFKISKLEECVRNKDLEIEKCLKRLNVYENKLHKIGQTNQTIHMIMPSKDTLYNGKKGIGFENPNYFEKAKYLRPSLYDEKVIGLGYTLMFLTHFDEALEIEKYKRARENKIEFAYDYGNLNAKKIIIDLEDEVVSLLEKEKANLETIESLKSKGFESSENTISESKNQSEKECDQVENSKVIAPGMFKLSVSQSVSPISMSKTSYDSKNVENKTKRKRRTRKSSKQNDKQVNNDVSRANSDFVHFSDLDTFSSIVQIYLWIINSRCSKHMTGNRALLTNFLENFLGTVCFGNNDFAVIAGYGDVVIGSMPKRKFTMSKA